MKFDSAALVPSPAVTRLVAAVAGTLLLAFAAVRSGRSGDERRLQLRAVDSTLTTFADWRRRFQPAIAAESISWRRALMEVRDLGVAGDERLAVTRQVARAAEFAGLENVHVLIGAPDTTGSDARLSTGSVRRQPAPFGLVVECRGNLQAIIAFVGGLPPAVALSSMRLVRQDQPGRHRITLAVYEIDFENVAASGGRPSVERGAAGRGGHDRAGG